MNGVHDMGGMHDFGPIEREANEPVFHAGWEGRIFAMVRAMGYTRAFTVDMARFSREALPPAVYLTSSYYKRWQLALENLLEQIGLIAADELAAGRALRQSVPAPRVLRPEEHQQIICHGEYDRKPRTPARFGIGDRVRARNINSLSHTRLPRYARGHVGVVECVRGCHVYPDSTVLGRGEDPHWLYTVLFDGRELWGEMADPDVKISIEAWEPYLEAV